MNALEAENAINSKSAVAVMDSQEDIWTLSTDGGYWCNNRAMWFERMLSKYEPYRALVFADNTNDPTADVACPYSHQSELEY